MKLFNDIGVRALLALILVFALVLMIFIGKKIPAEFFALVTMAVTFYFANRSTLDKM